MLPIDEFRVLLHRKYNPLSYSASFIPHNTCRPTTSNLYLANSLANVEYDPDLYRLHTFHLQNFMSLFKCQDCAKRSVQARGNCESFVTRPGFGVRSC